MTYRCFPVGELQTNCYLLWDENGKALIIDPGDNAPLLLGQLRRQGLTLEGILLTHVHFDHLLAVTELADATGAPFLVPEADAPAINDPTVSLSSWMRGPAPVLPAPSRLLREGDTVAAGSLLLTVLHTPGHTPGSSCFLTEGVLFAGDTLFAGSAGRTDFPGGSTAMLLRSLKRLMTLPAETVVLPGHDEASTIGREQRENPYIRIG